ncbi:hypothetical protein BY458DRAFT_530168 [Sporodiniella umbellata]|nr:hypothetical protein BY458DRAFT_530168 [Sporodiniella umbellata]
MSFSVIFVLWFLILLNGVFFYFQLNRRSTSYNPPQYGLSSARPKHRKFTSKAVEEFLVSMEPLVKDKDLYTLLKNCLPNTLDTTVEWFNDNSTDPRTFLITGDSKCYTYIFRL